jgi:hypothetical protein
VAKGAVQAILDLIPDDDAAAAAVSRATAGGQDGHRRPDRDREAVGGEVGIGTQMLESSAIAQLEDGPLAAAVETADAFAQVVPEDKYRIVKALQARGLIVGMTGDGVNDAPALKRADARIAVSRATDAARAAADIVLLAPGLSVIVEAVQRAREVFRRMTNYAIYRVSETIRVVVFVTLSIVASNFFPVTATQSRGPDAALPQRWDLVALAWGYALVWSLVLDQLKLIADRWLERRAGNQSARARPGKSILGGRRTPTRDPSTRS